MGILGAGNARELLEQLPEGVAASAAALDRALDELLAVRYAPLGPGQVRAAGVFWQRALSRMAALQLAGLAAIEARDDVVPCSRGPQGAVFAQHVLGLSRAQARRDAQVAVLVRPDMGDLRRMGSAYAAGTVTRGHVEVAVRVHRELGERVREELVEVAGLTRGDVCAPSPRPEDGTGAALAELAAECGVFGSTVRQVLVVDAVLAHFSRLLTVPEVDAIARRIVEQLSPSRPSGAHERRFLHMSQSFDGTWVGAFACGSAQGAVLKAALQALSAPRHGLAVDADGVEHVVPDTRDLGARQMDALTDLVQSALAKNGIDLTPAPSPAADSDEPDQPDGPEQPMYSNGADRPDPGDESPESEGEYRVVREPGVVTGPLPAVDLVVLVGVEHLAAARAALRRQRRRDELPLGLHARGDERPAGQPGAAHDDTSHDDTPHDAGPDDGGHGAAHGFASALDRALSPFAAAARVEHAGCVDAETLEMLACSAAARAVVLAPEGAVLHLGRSQRLATHAQKVALMARDGGCVVPGCQVPGDACEAHHPTWWSEGGPTDIDNLALACARHHTEIHQGTWEILMRAGVPWVRLPSWIDTARPLLRNAVHHPGRHRSGSQ